MPYPHRLEMYLRARYGEDGLPNPRIDVLNRGRGGEEANEELRRFDSDIFAEKPSLVIWQVGTNAVFHNYDRDEVTASIAEGLQRLAVAPMDVLLIDPQYTPAMLFDDKAEAFERMVSLIAAAAGKANVNPIPALGADATLARAQQYRFGSIFRPHGSGQAASERLEYAPDGKSAQRRDYQGTPSSGPAPPAAAIRADR